MTPERWQRIQELFHAAEGLAREEQESFLRRASPGEDSVYREVQALLACDGESGIGDAVGRAAQEWQAAPGAPKGYRILGQIGEGGMGIVYEAEQLNPPRRVALKVIRSARGADPRARRLFQREAEALGRLSHPGIATIYESGMTPDGTPFIAMELVGGLPLNEWLATLPAPRAARKDDLGNRLAVFRAICEAMIYAHQNGVIHRDLKPSNILVQDGAVKVLDFGLARIAEAGDQTESGVVQGSLPYMSPEQAMGDSSRIDTRTDIHALGIILYGMITGHHPYLEGQQSFVESLRLIRDATPRRFSEWMPRWDADLEAIVLKAMEKDREHRYQSVTDLATDLDRYIGDLPILARPPDTLYQVRKLIRRHRAAFGIVLLIVVLVAGFTVSTAVQARRLRVERDRANQEAATAKQTSDFLVDLFRNTNPAEAGGKVTAQDLLKTGRARLAKELGNQPELRARLLDRIGDAYSVVGPVAEARLVYQESLRLREAAFGPDSLASATSWGGLSTTSLNEGNYAAAVQEGRRALAIRQKFLAADDPQLSTANDIVAGALAAGGNFTEAEVYSRKAVEIDRSHPELSPREKAEGLTTLGGILRQQGRYAEAIPVLREAIALRRSLPDGDAESGYALNELATALSQSGDAAAAEREYREVLKVTTRVYGAAHSNVAVVMANVAGALNVQHRYGEAEKLAVEALAIFEKGAGRGHPRSGGFLQTIGEAEEGQGQIADAGLHFHEAQAIATKGFGASSLRTARMSVRLAEWESRFGDAGLALKLVESARGAIKPDTADWALADRAEGEARLRRGERPAAIDKLTQSREVLARKLGRAHWQTGRSAEALARAASASPVQSGLNP